MSENRLLHFVVQLGLCAGDGPEEEECWHENTSRKLFYYGRPCSWKNVEMTAVVGHVALLPCQTSVSIKLRAPQPGHTEPF